MALLRKTKNDNSPNGLPWEFVEKAKKTHKPSDASTIIEMDVELDCLQLKGAKDFYNDVVSILDKFEVTKSDGKLCMLITCKIQAKLYMPG